LRDQSKWAALTNRFCASSSGSRAGGLADQVVALGDVSGSALERVGLFAGDCAWVGFEGAQRGLELEACVGIVQLVAEEFA
jgi:hypothetical protein